MVRFTDGGCLCYIAGGRVRVVVQGEKDDNMDAGEYFSGYDDGVLLNSPVDEWTPDNVKGFMTLYGKIVMSSYEWDDEKGGVSSLTIAGNHFTVEDVVDFNSSTIYELCGYVEGQLQVIVDGNEVNGFVKNGRFHACITDYDPEISDNRCLSGINKHGSVPLASLESMLTLANEKLYGASLRGSWSPAESALHAALPLEVVATVIDYGDDGDPGPELPLLDYTVHL